MANGGGKQVELAALITTVALLAAAVLVRGIRGEQPIAPQDRPREVDAIAEPMQLLGRGARLRIAELDARVSEPARTAWRTSSRVPFELKGCPKLVDWLDGAQGQQCERLIGDLRRGSRDDALAALVLTVQIARATEWDPGLLARTASAERLGALVHEWLRAWGERASSDGTLAEPALAAVLLYGGVMNVAAEAPPVGRYDAPYERALAALTSLLLDPQGQPTHLGRALRERYPAAANAFEKNDDDGLAGFHRECQRTYPELDGECDS